MCSVGADKISEIPAGLTFAEWEQVKFFNLHRTLVHDSNTIKTVALKMLNSRLSK